MHGIIYIGIKNYVEAKHGIDAWAGILEKAGLADKIFFKDKIYPDSEAAAIIKAASEMTGAAAESIMEDFGKFLAPSLMMLYRELIQPEWKTMDMLLHTESSIHETVRKEIPDANPPQLKFEQLGEKELILHYDSPRCMSSVAKGLIRGVADYYGEQVTLSEEAAPNGGAEILVTIQ